MCEDSTTSEEKPLARMAELSAYVRDESGDLRPRMETLSKSGA